METAQEKMHFLATTPLEDISFRHIQPSRYNNWLNLIENDFDSLEPLVSGGGRKLGKRAGEDQKSVFNFSFR
jgi:predicted helicase